jgi:hypothetical protein
MLLVILPFRWVNMVLDLAEPTAFLLNQSYIAILLKANLKCTVWVRAVLDTGVLSPVVSAGDYTPAFTA